MDNLLVRIHFIIEMIVRTGLAPWEFEFTCPSSLISIFPQVNAVAYTLDGKRIITGSSDHTIRIWDASSGMCLPPPPIARAPVDFFMGVDKLNFRFFWGVELFLSVPCFVGLKSLLVRLKFLDGCAVKHNLLWSGTRMVRHSPSPRILRLEVDCA